MQQHCVIAHAAHGLLCLLSGPPGAGCMMWVKFAARDSSADAHVARIILFAFWSFFAVLLLAQLMPARTDASANYRDSAS